MRYLILLIALAGCGPSVVLERELPKLVGQPVDVAVDRFGLPTSEQTIMGSRVYVWSISKQVVSLEPAFASSGRIDSVNPIQTTAIVPVATSGTCVIRVQVDTGGIIRRADWQGDSAACRRYSNRL